MGTLRTIAAYVLLAVLLAATLWLLEPPVGLQEAGVFAVAVDGPDGPIWNGTVEVEDADPLSVLLAAADSGGFDVTVRGSGSMAYVVAVAGYAESGTGGWCFAVGGPGQWNHPDRSAGAITLAQGEDVWWHWADAPEECGEA